MPIRVTADDVAQAAGVSRAMVSRAFTPGASVSAKKREHVLAVAQALGYRPNLIARGLTGRSTGLIAVVAGEISRPYEAWLLEHLVFESTVPCVHISRYYCQRCAAVTSPR